MKEIPISAREKTCDMIYFPRMLDKIRKHARGELREDYQANLGKGFDMRCCRYLRIDYPALTARVLEGGTNEEIFAWAQQAGRQMSPEDIVVWNAFLTKRGWNDEATSTLEKYKAENKLGHRSDIITFLGFFDADEGRTP